MKLWLWGSIENVNGAAKMRLIVLSLLNGISLGAILFLVAAGLSLVLGTMGVLNLAHGATYMLGAYVGWTISVSLGWNYLVALLVAGLACALLGLVMERGFLSRVHGRLNQQVLLTFGMVYIIGNVCLWIWGGCPKAPFSAPALSASFPIMGGSYSVARVVIAAVGVLFAVGLYLLQTKTRYGAIVRAGMDDKEITLALGVNYRAVASLVFVTGCFIAGVAGTLGATLYGAHLELGIDILLLAVAVIVVGGLGSTQGALAGGILIGIVISVGKAYASDLSMFFVYLVMVGVLLIRPGGLLGKPVRRV